MRVEGMGAVVVGSLFLFIWVLLLEEAQVGLGRLRVMWIMVRVFVCGDGNARSKCVRYG